MVEIVPFQAEHLAALRIQAVQASAQPLMTVEHGTRIAEQVGLAKTVLVDGKPIACAGVIEVWKGRAFAWSYLGEGWERQMRLVHRAALAGLRACRWRRVEMAVDPRHPEGKRWALHLGFEFEGLARKFTPDGRDAEIWARVT